MTLLNCFSCFHDGRKFIKQNIALYLWESVDSISLVLDGRLNTLLTRSVHLSKIASLSVRRVPPSRLRNVVAPGLWVINIICVHSS